MGSLTLHDADALLVIDVQNDFCSGGRLAVPGGEEVVAPVNALMPLFRHVVLTQDWHPAGHQSFASSHPGRAPYETIALPYGPQVLWPDHCVQGHAGAEFHPDLARSRANLIQRKGSDPKIDSYSAFRENDARTVTGLAGWLKDRDVKRIFLTGLAFDFCVLWSAEDAHRAGFEVVVVADACRAIDLNDSAANARHRLAALDIACVTAADIVAPSEA